MYVKNRGLRSERIVLPSKSVPDKYGAEDKEVEMKESKDENMSVSERFQRMCEEIAGETEEEKKKTLEYVEGLTEKEAKVYLKFMKKGKGEKDVSLTTADREFLQRALKKIHLKEDKFKRNSSENLLREYYEWSVMYVISSQRVKTKIGKNSSSNTFMS